MALAGRRRQLASAVTVVLCLAIASRDVTAVMLAAGACPYTTAVYTKTATAAITSACDTTNLMFGETTQADYCNTCHCALISNLNPSAAVAAAKTAAAATAKPSAVITRNDVIAGVLANDPKSTEIFAACIDTELNGLSVFNTITADEATGIKNCVTDTNLVDRKRMAAGCLAPKKVPARLVSGRKYLY